MTQIALNSLKCDWYGATFNNLKNNLEIHINFINDVRMGFESMLKSEVIFIELEKGFRGYPLSGKYCYFDSLTGSVGDQICIVGYGSDRQEMGVHISVSGQYSHDFRDFVLDKMVDDPRFYHNVSRCDVAFDFTELDDVESVFDRFKAFALKRKLSTHYEGDWDYGEKGRTYYIGRPTSPVRIVLYEKGIQQINQKVIEDSPLVRNWLRLEVRVTGQKGRGANMSYADLREIMFCTKNVRDLVASALPEFDFNALKSELLSVVSRSDNDPLRSLVYMCDTYRNSIKDVLSSHFDGDRDRLFEFIADRVFNN